MSARNPTPILVAVGNDSMDPALAWAAAEAAREECGLHLVHVVHRVAQGPEMPLVEAIDLHQMGRRTLGSAAERARLLMSDGASVTTDLASGGVVASLVDAARNGVRMVVLQHRELSRMHRVVTRSITSGVAAQAMVPVTSVPSSWTPEQDGSGTVTVGVDVPERSHEVMRAAADAAVRRGAQLRILHVVRIPDSYFDALPTQSDIQAWMDQGSAALRRAVEGLGDVSPVSVKEETLPGTAADRLLEASESTDLLVLGRHDPLTPVGSHLGPVARAVIREARCPVLLADPQPARRWWRSHQDPSPGPTSFPQG